MYDAKTAHRWLNWESDIYASWVWDELDRIDQANEIDDRCKKQDEEMKQAREERLKNIRFDPKEIEDEKWGMMKNTPAATGIHANHGGKRHRGSGDRRSARLAANISEVVDRIDAGEDKKAICAEYHVHSDTLKTWVNRERERRLINGDTK